MTMSAVEPYPEHLRPVPDYGQGDPPVHGEDEAAAPVATAAPPPPAGIPG